MLDAESVTTAGGELQGVLLQRLPDAEMLVDAVATRDIAVRYRQSVLGVGRGRPAEALGGRDELGREGGNDRGEPDRENVRGAGVSARPDPGVRASAAGIASGIGLGQPPGAKFLSAGQWREITAPLCLTAKAINMVRAQRGVRGNNDSDRPVDPRQFFDRQSIAHVVQPCAAIHSPAASSPEGIDTSGVASRCWRIAASSIRSHKAARIAARIG